MLLIETMLISQVNEHMFFIAEDRKIGSLVTKVNTRSILEVQ